MIDCLRAAGASAALGEGPQSGLVVGGGGTARAAIHTLHEMGYAPIYLVGRNHDKMVELAASFPPNYDLVVLDAADDETAAIKRMPSLPVVAIATVPANMPLDATLSKFLHALFSHSAKSATSTAQVGQGTSAPTRTLLELAYKPAHTAVMKMAEELGGWKTVQGLETLVTPGHVAV